MHWDNGKGLSEFDLLEPEITEPRFKTHDCSGLTLNPNILYTFKVQSLNYIGLSELSSAYSTRTVVTSKPLRPSIIVYLEQREILLDWSSNVFEGERPEDFLILVNEDGFGWQVMKENLITT